MLRQRRGFRARNRVHAPRHCWATWVGLRRVVLKISFAYSPAHIHHEWEAEQDNVCLPCPVGSYNAEATSIVDCSQCPAFSTTTSTSSTALLDCKCSPGYSGYHCEVDVNECASKPCQTGTCVESNSRSSGVNVNKYECKIHPTTNKCIYFSIARRNWCSNKHKVWSATRFR